MKPLKIIRRTKKKIEIGEEDVRSTEVASITFHWPAFKLMAAHNYFKEDEKYCLTRKAAYPDKCGGFIPEE